MTIVIPVFNQLYNTKVTCESLIECTEDFVLIIVDDGCTDETEQYCIELKERLGDKLFYIKNASNLGVNASWNVGLRVAMELPSEHICIANNDLHFTQKWNDPLIEALDNGYVLVSPMSTEQELPADFPRGSTRHTNPVKDIPVLGACFAFKKELINTIGYFPEEMRYYFGDSWIIDQSKLRGLKIGHIQESYIHHYFCVSSSKLDNRHWFTVDGDAYNDYCRNYKHDTK